MARNRNAPKCANFHRNAPKFSRKGQKKAPARELFYKFVTVIVTFRICRNGGVNHYHDKPRVFLDPNKKPVRFDVTLLETFVFSGEFVWLVFLSKTPVL